ncbi:MAG TPA: T9SS type A sorting domain-containing protein [Ignavibacteriaceae bacterium]|nr:T9SS type A sorting domain-containing protein [Ignavibacteriaceae bacterium]
MKLIKLFIIVVLFFSSQSFSQYKMIIQNGERKSGTTFEFDVYIQSTGADFTLTSYQVCLNYATGLEAAGTLSFQYLAGTSQLSIPPATINVISDIDAEKNLVATSNPGTQIISSSLLKVGTFRITNTVNFANIPFIINWDWDGIFKAEVNISNVNRAIASNHFNYNAPYLAKLLNDVQVSPTEYEFDISLESSAVDFLMTSYQFILNYNTAVANGGSLTLSYIPGTTELTSCTPSVTVIQLDGAISNLLIGSNPGTQTISTAPLRVGRFRLTNSIPFSTNSANVNWDFIGSNVTQVNIRNTNFTTQVNHINNLSNVPLPVEIVTFTAKEVDKKVKLNWVTATEEKNYGFDVERKSDNGSWEKIGFLQGAGNSNSLKEYHFTDAQVNGTQLQYRLKQIDTDGKTHYTNSVEVKLLPTAFGLTQNYPNPFNPETTIKYQLPVDSKVKLVVYNMIGEEVASLINGVVPAGYHSVNFNAAGLSSGNYIYRLETPDFVQVKKMIVLK